MFVDSIFVCCDWLHLSAINISLINGITVGMPDARDMPAPTNNARPVCEDFVTSVRKFAGNGLPPLALCLTTIKLHYAI
jgi:hypothetical protein